MLKSIRTRCDLTVAIRRCSGARTSCAPDPLSFAGTGFVGGSQQFELLDAGETGTTACGSWETAPATARRRRSGGRPQVAEASEIDVAYEWTFEGLDPGRCYDGGCLAGQVGSACPVGPQRRVAAQPFGTLKLRC